jgi:hypothetical protein
MKALSARCVPERLINDAADELNAEAEEVLQFQAPDKY